jgi:hypothetical protein
VMGLDLYRRTKLKRMEGKHVIKNQYSLKKNQRPHYTPHDSFNAKCTCTCECPVTNCNCDHDPDKCPVHSRFLTKEYKKSWG